MSCARGTRRRAHRTSSGAPAPRPRSGAPTSTSRCRTSSAKARRWAATIRSDVSTKFNGTFWVPDFAAWTAVTANFDPRHARHARAARATSTRGRARSRSSRAASSRWKLDPNADRAAVGGRVPPAARVSEREPRRRTSTSEHSTQTIVGLQYEPHEGTRVQASAYYTDRTQLITHEHGRLARQRGPRHDLRRASCSRRIAAARGSAGCRTRTRTRRASIIPAIRAACSRSISRTA